MELDPTICYQAVLSRDPRFDGRFFGGVVTTGVYCRPVCRVRPPRPENIRWFACAAAAEAAGFRPCRRCRPEAAPGTSAWLGSSAVVSRALRLISEGVLDETGLEELSARLGIGSRHLRRLFAEHLGRCPALADALAAAPGLRVPGAWDGFELAVRAVLGQQDSEAAATTLAGRLVKAFGAPLPGYENLALTHLFPQPEALAEADLRVIGITEARANTIRALASSVARGELELDASHGLDEAISRLRVIPGIDDWSANYIAMRALGETDALPSDDLGLRRALGARNSRKSLVSARELTKIADEWRPWRAYAAMHLWASLAGAADGNEGGRIYATNHTATKSRGISSAACG